MAVSAEKINGGCEMLVECTCKDAKELAKGMLKGRGASSWTTFAEAYT